MEYFNQYGPDCTYYAITGRQLGDNDCCWWDKQNEFRAAVHVGLDKWIPFVQRFQKLN